MRIKIENSELLTTVILGAYGIKQINKGSRAYQKGDFKKGSKCLCVGNGTMTALAAINELLRNGRVAIYTGAQLPFALAGLVQYLKHNAKKSKNRIYNGLLKLANKYTTIPALVFNIIIRIWLFQTGCINPLICLDWLRHVGFVGLSTSFVMPTTGTGKITKHFSAKQERFFITLITRAILTFALSVDVINSSISVIQFQDIGQANLLALIWLILNATALKQDFITFNREICKNNFVNSYSEKLLALNYYKKVKFRKMDYEIKTLDKNKNTYMLSTKIKTINT